MSEGGSHVYVTAKMLDECACDHPHERHGSFMWSGAAEPVKHVVTEVLIHERRDSGKSD